MFKIEWEPTDQPVKQAKQYTVDEVVTAVAKLALMNGGSLEGIAVPEGFKDKVLYKMALLKQKGKP